MNRAETNALAAIRAGARRHAERIGRSVHRGRVSQVSPLIVDLLASDLLLEEDQIELGQDVARYDDTDGIAVGDILALLEVEQGDWIAVTVVSDRHPTRPASQDELDAAVDTLQDEIDALSAGGGDKTFHWHQGSAAATWGPVDPVTHLVLPIPHMLGKFTAPPTVINSFGETVEGEIDYIDLNHVTLKFGGAFAGDAYFN